HLHLVHLHAFPTRRSSDLNSLLDADAGEGTNFHLGCEVIHVVWLTNHGADPAGEECQRDGDDARVLQREEGPVSAGNHGGLGAGDCRGEEDQQQCGDQAGVDGGDCTGGVELLPVLGVQDGRQVGGRCDSEGQGDQEGDVLGHGQDAQDDGDDTDDDNGDAGDADLLGLGGLAVTENTVVDVVADSCGGGDGQAGDHGEH